MLSWPSFYAEPGATLRVYNTTQYFWSNTIFYRADCNYQEAGTPPDGEKVRPKPVLAGFLSSTMIYLAIVVCAVAQGLLLGNPIESIFWRFATDVHCAEANGDSAGVGGCDQGPADVFLFFFRVYHACRVSPVPCSVPSAVIQYKPARYVYIVAQPLTEVQYPMP